ncbi:MULTISPECIES: aminotransferase class I/II-fold pyridoxal phosphate-dependent enzyme [Microbacterium]|uniref:aminotransferase class I/II-fold pyridoxal phosphate-dependent enzyme n=1 Tax=Microbacterium TaxID=33882 RepID=UPI002788C058|nr:MULTISPECIES: aminotransferase class I/II-fold pyridoxal phosphate-dependent enzyme [Microbacterium]MDF2918876.1 aminotransferase [Microbacterium sp.]MDQ1074257.1 aminotransferase [Microbacterium sp. SORGH_AS_0969]MDQ1114484.1 aminotransferase [Microbacterium testaceum]
MVDFEPAARVDALPPNFWGAMDAENARIAALPGPRFIDVSKGNPDLPTPERIVEAMQRFVADPVNHRYPSYAARPSLREGVVQRYREDHGLDLDPDSQVAVFHGSHEALMAAVLGLADPGSTVVLPDPGYPMYTSAVDLAQARAATLPLVGPDHQPDFAALAHLDRARVLLLNYPNNPTGAVATPATFEAAIAFADRVGAAFVHDFAYSSLGFEARPLSALEVDGADGRTVEVQTLSKTYSMAGWRVGFAAGNATIIAAMRRYQAHAFSTMFGATQEAAAAALRGDQSAAADLVEVYRRRRDLVVAGLRAIGWDVIEPRGTFFVWVRLPARTDAVAFARRLREEARVAVAPGDGFGPRGRGHVRLGLVVDDATLHELVERLASFSADPSA